MDLATRSDEEILAVIDPMMDNLMAASTAIDHARHVRDFTDRLKAIVTPEAFDKICRNYQAKWGLLGEREFVALFRRESSIAVVWKQFCTETDDEFVAELVLVEEDGRYLIDHVVFF